MRYLFQHYVLDADCFELQSNGQRINIEPQALALLLLLVQNRHRLVTKDEIYDEIWTGKVVSESALSSRIKMLRHAIGDDGKNQRFVRTIHGKGFRFIVDVSVTETTEKEIHTNDGEFAASSSHSSPPSNLGKHNAKPAVIVLPFTNLSNDIEQEYFSDGISADIITLLSKHRWLCVSARNICFGFKSQNVDIPTLAKKLNIDYAVEGSVQKIGERVRITAQLIDVESGAAKWSEKFDRDLDDLFVLQDEITEKIVARLEPEIGFAERRRVIGAGTKNLLAWDYFHLGVYHFFKFTAEDNIHAQALLNKSINSDPSFGDAYSWWAYAVVLGMVYWETKPTSKLLQQALDACGKALSIDAQNATYYALRGRVQLARREYHLAIQDNEKAISLNPTFAAAYCGLGDSLAYEGRYKESMVCFERAVALSPNDPQAWAFLSYGALALIFMGDYTQALKWTDKALGVPNCQYWTMAHRVVIYAYLNDTEAMNKAREKLLLMQPKFTLEFAREKLFYLNIPEQKYLYINGLQKSGVR